eukprot:gnl/TRDRNA2_/TRDRNA2_123759_c0_seq1.p1 gnl/TRDRNA2_/TRDRNA2_123759_c0~~gnl/TRDRNA2_/TRDRNA2_123759_c0_seq1.p1  ORF type:complete len:333 (+),score=45.45 gnl/TRDRNA2_/TRDRNA2_123759_c0_seq1:38-1000(+)
MDASGVLPGALAPHEGTRRFRDRMLRTHLGANSVIAASAAHRHRERTLRASIIYNRRYSTVEDHMLDDVAETLTKEGIPTEYFDWARVGEYRGDFRAHLKKVLQTDVMVSSVGQAAMYLPFMGDGSVFVALGYVLHESLFVDRKFGQGEKDPRTGFPVRVTPAFQEQHVSAGTPYVKTLYYTSTERMNGLKAERIMSLVKEARQIVKTGFETPVKVQENLSPEGLVLRDVCVKDAKACERMMQLRNSGPVACTKALWPEHIVYEIGPWGLGGSCKWWEGDSMSEPTVLRASRAAFGLPAYEAPPLDPAYPVIPDARALDG